MNDNFVILNFPRFSGGKFISNCLSLSRYCCPQDPVIARNVLSRPDDYNYRFSSIIRTLPPGRSDMSRWIQHYEFGDFQLYGEAVTQWQHGISCPPTELVNQLLDYGFKLFLTSHGGDLAVRNLLIPWPESTVVTLINHVEFSTISKKLKSTDTCSLDDYAGNYCKAKYESLAGESWPPWSEFESVGYDIDQLQTHRLVADEISKIYNWQGINAQPILFDVDAAIFDKHKFLESMQVLYEKLNLDDFDPELVGKFWQLYMTLHVDNVDVM
jgi:hypothetical protein